MGNNEIKKEAIFIATHFINKDLINKIKKILRDTGFEKDLYILSWNTWIVSHNPEIKKIIFDHEHIKPLHERWILDNEMDICRINIVKVLQKNNIPLYDYYWFIEYDVDYRGNWGELLDIKNESDLICTHLIDYTENDKWVWWKYFNTPMKNIKKMRAFLPIYRISRNMLEEIGTAITQEDWRGHIEALIPTIVGVKNGKINEIWWNSKYTLPQNINKFYNSYPSWYEIWFGEFRWIPHMLNSCKRKERLYHPIKKYPENIYSIKYFFRKIDKLIELKLSYTKKNNIWSERKYNFLKTLYKKIKKIWQTR